MLAASLACIVPIVHTRTYDVRYIFELFAYAPLFRKQFFLLNKIEILYKFP